MQSQSHLLDEASHTTLTLTQLMSFLPQFIQLRGQDRMALCLWGPWGIGKSESVEQACEIAGYECRNWMRLSQIDASEMKGAPDILNSERVLNWLTPSWFPMGPKICLFFDELGNGLPSVQGAAMQAFLEYCIGQNKFPDDTCVIAASNREGDRTGVHRMLGALASRVIHINLVPDVVSWCLRSFKIGVDPALIAYIRFRPQALHEFNPALRVSPNPRAWVRCSKIRAMKLDRMVERALFCGSVGDARALECLAYLDLYSKGLPDLDAILMAPKTAPVPKSLDVQVAVASGLSVKATQRNLGAVVQYTERLGPELDMFAISGAVSRDQAKLDTPAYMGLTATKAYQEWIIRNQKFHM